MLAVLAPAPRRAVPRGGRARRDQDRARPPPRRHPRDVLPQPVLRRQAEGDAGQARLRRRPARGDPAARLRRRGATSRRTPRRRRFPIIPCTLCGSQENLQRKQVGEMLREWEKRHPGRVESILRALTEVRPSHLLDRKLFDFVELRKHEEADRPGAAAQKGRAPGDAHRLRLPDRAPGGRGGRRPHPGRRLARHGRAGLRLDAAGHARRDGPPHRAPRARGAPEAFVIADLPFLSYGTPEQALGMRRG